MIKSQHISRRSLADEVADRLREQVVAGVYKVDEKLPVEAELMKQFGVGRSTVREAIKLLVNSGFLRVQQGLGTFVQQSTVGSEPLNNRLKRANNEELDEIRQLLEIKIAEKAAVNRSEADVVAIRTHLDNRAKAAKANDLKACVEADINFHTSIAVASGNAILADLYYLAATHLKNWFLADNKDTSKFLETHKLHEELLLQIASKNPKDALKVASKILSRDLK